MRDGLGGNTVAEQRELRQEFDALLREFKQAARNRVSLKFVFQGSRTATRDAFMAKINQMSPRVVPVLLVDSEETPRVVSIVPAEETPKQKTQGLRYDAIHRKKHLTERPNVNF